MSPGERRTLRDGESDLVGWVAEYLARAGPRFVVLHGSVGAGKSSFLRALFPRMTGDAVFLLYQQPTATGADGLNRMQAGGATTLLLADPRHQDHPPEEARTDVPILAGLAAESGKSSAYEVPPAFRQVLERMVRAGGGCLLLDSWDRDSERFARGLVTDPAAVATFGLPAKEFAVLQSAVLGLKCNLVLAVVPELAASLQSLADVVVELKEETRRGARVRIISVPKSRGSAVESRDHLYTLEDGRFHSVADLPPTFTPPVAEPDPDPEPTAGTIWPGSVAFHGAFGRLKYGALTAVTLAPEASDPLAQAIVQPLVSHTLRTGGRVVWMPAPSVRPAKVVGLLREHVPAEWIRERLRIISASGEEPALGELASAVLPLRREVGSGDLRAATAPGVGPIFPDAHKFLRTAPESTPSLYVLSMEGLRASAAAVGIALNAATLPSVLAAYARLPRFHGFGYGQADDPLATALLPMVSTLLHLQIVCGRPVLHGERPRTSAYVMDWTGDVGRYRLLPCQ